MAAPPYRSRNHPKVPDLFARLRAQDCEPKTVGMIEDWLGGTALTNVAPPPEPTPPLSEVQRSVPRSHRSFSNRPLHTHNWTPKPPCLLPLQPIYGNRAPLPPRPNRKRKMPPNEIPRQSARFKKATPPDLVGEGVPAKEKQSGPSAQGRKIQKPSKNSGAKEVKQRISSTIHTSSGDEASAEETGGGRAPTVQQEILVGAAASYIPSRSSGRSPSKKSSSPTKGSRTLSKRERMQFLTPRILFTTLIAIKDEGHLTGSLETLWLDYIKWNNRAIVPMDLKESLNKVFDTPKKTKEPIPDEYFGAPYARYAKEDHDLMQATITDVLNMADLYRHSGCTEAHWVSVVVNPLLSLVRRLTCYQNKGSKIEVVDLTTVDINPSSLCPTHAESLFKDLDKRIDAAIGLHLSYSKRKTLSNGVYSDGTIPSINQTDSFVNFLPMFANIEVKKANTDRDPLIQLGAWIAAEFNKRKTEGYSLDMPILAIEIEGDAWNLHMVFAIEDPKGGDFECNFVGPFEMGSTKSIMGIFQIVDRLCRCVDWGIREYQQWFNSEVQAKYGKV